MSVKHLIFVSLLLLSVAASAQAGQQFWQAACNGDMLGVQNGLLRHVPVDYEGPGGFTGLLCAARNGHLVIVKYLVANGADVNRRDNSRDKTPLLAASFKGHLDIVQYLLTQHAQINIQAINGWTALHDAAYIGNLPIVRTLVSAGASLTLKNELDEKPVDTAFRAYSTCRNRKTSCPTARGDSSAGLAAYKATYVYLRGLQ